MKAELFTPVLKWLDGHASPLGFNMNYFQQEDQLDFEGETCGTVMCIAGAVALFNNLSVPSYPADEQILAVRKALEMSAEDSDRLFYAMEDEIGDLAPDQDLSQITPVQAALTLRHYIATGEVDWNL